MVESVKGLKRTKYCGNFGRSDIGEQAVVFGWVQRVRNKGQLLFVILRDRTGLVQLIFDDRTQRALFEKAAGLKSEYVVAAVGQVQERSAKNKEMATGEVEIRVTELRILNVAQTPPFEILDATTAKEELRLKYRYLDLRRPRLQRHMEMRSKITKATRDYFDRHGFIELETPMLMKSTPEGARDFLVPSRLQKGSFYALPQSPQIYKQLCMVSGFDRYFQLARCFRDEDQRADRQPEFTQVDMEMSFVDTEDVLAMGEGYIKYLMQQVLGQEMPAAFPRMSYEEAMARYGTDKPDTRYGMELCELSALGEGCGFGVFANAVKQGGMVGAITAKDGVKTYSRKAIDKLTEAMRGIGARGLAWIRMTAEGPTASFAKFLSREELDAWIARTGARTGDVVLIIAEEDRTRCRQYLGYLRGLVAKELDLIPKGRYHFLWLTQMPFFEWDAETESWAAMHHAFTAPMDDCLPYLETDQGRVKAKAFDLVLNGQELCSGSIRITDPVLQERMFRLLGLSPEEAAEKFGFLLEAFRYGAPPHGGLGFGLDRIAAELLGADSLREVVAFPKTAAMTELMSQAPAGVAPEQLEELGIQLKKT